MGKMKELFTLQEEMFDTVEKMMDTYTLRKKDIYQRYLVRLEELNYEYEAISKQKYIPEIDMVKYYEKLWSF